MEEGVGWEMGGWEVEGGLRDGGRGARDKVVHRDRQTDIASPCPRLSRCTLCSPILPLPTPPIT